MKILKNKRGFSLVELMVVVAIMGVLSAIAIPSYLSYQDNARQGVVESMLHLVDRTIAIEVARGQSLNDVETNVLTNVWGKIQSNDKDKFKDPKAADFDVTGNKWCLQIAGKAAVDAVPAGSGTAAVDAFDGTYDGYVGCVSNDIGTPDKKVKAEKSGTATCTAGVCS